MLRMEWELSKVGQDAENKKEVVWVSNRMFQLKILTNMGNDLRITRWWHQIFEWAANSISGDYTGSSLIKNLYVFQEEFWEFLDAEFSDPFPLFINHKFSRL